MLLLRTYCQISKCYREALCCSSSRMSYEIVSIPLTGDTVAAIDRVRYQEKAKVARA